MRTYKGGCACGAVRYRLTGPPMFTHCCHCRDCQKQTGGGFAINTLYETSLIETLQGEPAPVSMPTDSGRPHDIYRCPTCQVALWSDYGRRPYVRFIRVLTLDQPDAITPDVHIYWRSRVPWVRVPDDVRKFETFYDMKAEWPQEMLERRAAASAAAKN